MILSNMKISPVKIKNISTHSSVPDELCKYRMIVAWEHPRQARESYHVESKIIFFFTYTLLNEDIARTEKEYQTRRRFEQIIYKPTRPIGNQ